MRRLQVAELRDSWTAWLGVCLTFITVNFALALSALVEHVGVDAVLSGRMDYWSSASYTFAPALNLVLCLIVGAVVIGGSTSLVVDSRRGSLARLSLVGATPAQVVSTIMSQLVVVSLACAVVGDLVAYAMLQPTLQYLNDDPTLQLVVPDAVYAVWPVLAANLAAAGIALIGGHRQARRAGAIPPVEALRIAAAAPDERMGAARWVRFGLCVAVLAAAFALIPVLVSLEPKERFSNVVLAAVVVLIVAGAMLSVLAPAIVGPVTRAWTRLVPTRDPIWRLARTIAAVKGARFSKSVTPVMMTIGLLFGMVLLGGVMTGVVRSLGVELSAAGPTTMVSMLGLPLAVALSGGVGSLLMMAKQREAELALVGVAGATPGQRFSLPVLEGVIVTVTGALLSLAMVGMTLGFLAVALPAAGFPLIVVPQYETFAASFGICLLVTIAATLGPSLGSLRKPEPAIIARLVAE
ncbi:MAG: hypothetical protein QM582_05580 [Micropruina sp.]|uniref:FtsX-like permease family protein n=1 Tax=Micropruina sp. TaxID=2737536 RepID=UPI0039E5DDEB